ncbi:MAG TPA: hypothetical protein VFE89_13140 [Beijerinckiaceae bacterium]|nr:hypothetical protein [Beijerinckiaceae bacterium]
MSVIRSFAFVATALLMVQAAPIAPAKAQTPFATIDDVTIDAGFATYRIKHIDVFGGPMSAADLRQLFDANDPKPLPERLRAVSADRIVASEIVAEPKAGTPGQTVTYRNFVLTGVNAGHVTDASAQSISMVLTDDNAGRISGDFGAMTAHNIDFVLAGRIAASSRSDANEAKGLLYENFSLDGGGFVAQKENVEITFGRISGSKIKARPFATPLSALPKDNSQPQVMTPEQKRMMAGFGADLLDSFDIGSFEVRDIGVKGISDAKPFNAHLDRMALADLGDAKIGEFSFAGFSTTSDHTRVSLGNVAFRGFDMSAMRTRMKAAASDIAQPLDEAKPRELMPNLREFSLSAFEYRGAGAGIVAGAGRGGANMRINKIETRSSDVYEGIPTALTASLDGLSFDVSATASNDSLRTIAGLGYSQVDLGSRMDVAWKQSAQELAANEVSVAAAGMGALRLKGTLTNVSKDLFAPEPAVAQAAALSALVKNVDLTVTDQGLLNRMIANEAKRSNRTPDAVRSEWVTAAAVGIPRAFGDATAGRTLGAAVSKFIAKPNTLHVSANAPNGIGAAELMLFSQDPAAFLKRMDVQASAE